MTETLEMTTPDLGAHRILDAWQHHRYDRLESERRRLGATHPHDSGDSERLELLEGIAEEMTNLLAGPRQAADEAAAVYCGLLRHLATGPRARSAA